jgi:beta-phosphoglucomutase-like phosphatase (HAD superfamily)
VIFDFDGVLIESELAENRHIAETLSDLGRPTDLRDAIREFTGLSGLDFVRALERWLDGPVPSAFDERRREQSVQLMQTGVDAVPGALTFVAALAPTRKTAIVSSSSTEWLRARRLSVRRPCAGRVAVPLFRHRGFHTRRYGCGCGRHACVRPAGGRPYRRRSGW